MKTVREIGNTRTEVAAYINERLEGWTQVEPQAITFIHQGLDTRNNWNTYLVYVEGHGPFGQANEAMVEG